MCPCQLCVAAAAQAWPIVHTFILGRVGPTHPYAGCAVLGSGQIVVV
jgi:hypothetical protein